MKKLLSTLGAIFLALGLSAVAPLGANAAASISATLPTAGVADGDTVNIPVTFSGVSFASVRVDVSATNGTVSLDYSSASATVTPGYESTDSGSAFAGTDISFSATKADAETLLATKLSFTSTGTAGTNEKPLISISISEFGVLVDSTTGHTYVYSATFDDAHQQLSWADAQAYAATTSKVGHAGYLVNITSAAENDFVAHKAGVLDVWIGATDDPTQVAAINTAKGLPAYVPVGANSQVDGHMIWGGGSEKGQVISDTLVTPVVPANGYASWANGEPNNWSGIEGCGVTNAGSTDGFWNDITCTATHYYMVEYDTTLADAPVALTYDSNTPPAAEPDLAATGADLAEPVAFIAFGFVLAVAGVVVKRKANKA